jgi:Saccharopine dehydrogenase NADP binding domain
LRVLIVGGYGTFGGRLVKLLADDSRITILVAGRSLERARGFCAGVTALAELVPVVFDRVRDAGQQLATLRPDILADASGPFQIYGNDPYALVEACLAQHVHYIDLADAPDFVDGIARYDAQARAAGIVMLSGISTTPVLTTAVIRRLVQGLEPRSVTAGIAPSPFSDIGLSVVRAVASYAGKRLRIRCGGRGAYATAAVDSRHFTIAPPGQIPLPRIRFSLVDTPDRVFVPRLWPGHLDVARCGTEAGALASHAQHAGVPASLATLPSTDALRRMVSRGDHAASLG